MIFKPVPLAIAVTLVACIMLGIGNIRDIVNLTINEGIEFLEKKGYTICQNVKFEEVKAAGIKPISEGWQAFVQICETICINLGNLKVYIDFGARVLFVYGDSEQSNEVHYVQFP